MCGLLQMLPFPGIINGLLVPTMLVPPYFFALSAQETVVYQFLWHQRGRNTALRKDYGGGRCI
ncbi:MAG: hypothetical protein K1W30_07990 [Lachnospiraceae bacterium]